MAKLEIRMLIATWLTLCLRKVKPLLIEIQKDKTTMS